MTDENGIVCPVIECTLVGGNVECQNIAPERLQERAEREIARYKKTGVAGDLDVFKLKDGEKFMSALLHSARSPNKFAEKE